MLPADMESGSAGRPTRSSYLPLAAPAPQLGRLRRTALAAGAAALAGVVTLVALGHRARPGVEASLERKEQLLERTASPGNYPPYLAGGAAGPDGDTAHYGAAGGTGVSATGTFAQGTQGASAANAMPQIPVDSAPTASANEIAADGSFQQDSRAPADTTEAAATYGVFGTTGAPAAAGQPRPWAPLPPQRAPGQWQQQHPMAGHALQTQGASLERPSDAAHAASPPTDGPASGVSMGSYSGKMGRAAGNGVPVSSPRLSAQSARDTAGGTGGNVGSSSLGSTGGMGRSPGDRGSVGDVAGAMASGPAVNTAGAGGTMGRGGSMDNVGSTVSAAGTASLSGTTGAMGNAGNVGDSSGTLGAMGNMGSVGDSSGTLGAMGNAGNVGDSSGTLGAMGIAGNTAPGGTGSAMGNLGASGGTGATGSVGAIGMGTMASTGNKVAAPMEKTTTTLTTTSLPNTTTTRPSVGLYCWALMMPHGPEVALVRTMLNKGASLFGCDDYTVFSSGNIELSPGPPSRIGTTSIGSVKCKYGGPWYLALNSQVFIKVWKRIFQDKIYRRHDWTVKIDPDAVFIPQRLREQVEDSNPDAVVYLNNCDQGLHGPIEVIATGGMKVFAKGVEDCEQHLSYEFEKWGEDVFLRHCLGMLKVNRVDNFKLLSEDRCFYENPAKNGCTSGKVAFHPFKDPDKYFQCLKQAKDGDQAAEHEK